MGVQFTNSAGKHGIPPEDALYAMLHAEASAEIDGGPGEAPTVYVGHPHGQTERYIEVIAAHRPRVPSSSSMQCHLVICSDTY